AVLGCHAHARRGELAFLEGSFVTTFGTSESEGHGYVTHHQHLIRGAARQLHERVLAWKSVEAFRRNNGIGHAVHAGYWNQFGLSMEGVVDMHVRHDLVRHFDQVVGHLLGTDLRQSELGLGVDQAGINSHSGYINDLSTGGDFGGTGGPYGGDLATLHDQHSVIDRSVGDGQQLPPFEHDWKLLSGSHCSQEQHEEKEIPR